MGFEFDTSQLPLVRARFAAQYSPAELHAWFTNITDDLARLGWPDFACITDTRDVAHSSPATRKVITEWFHNNEADFSKHVRAHALVVANTLEKKIIAAAVTAVIWLMPQGWPTKVFVDCAEAEAWAKKMAHRRG